MLPTSSCSVLFRLCKLLTEQNTECLNNPALIEGQEAGESADRKHLKGEKAQMRGHHKNEVLLHTLNMLLVFPIHFNHLNDPIVSNGAFM